MRSILEAGILLDGVLGLTRDPAVVERAEAAIALLDGAVANIRCVALDPANRDRT